MWLRSLTLLALALALALVAGAGAAQDPASKPPEAPPDANRPQVPAPDPEYDALRLKYSAAVRDYDDARIRRDRSPTPGEEIPHPSKRFLKEFQALGEKGSGPALAWIVENVRFIADAPAERLKLAQETLPKLLASEVDDAAMLKALEGLRPLHKDLGDALFTMATEVVAKGRSDEVIAQGKLLQAWARSEGDTTTDPKRWEDVTEIYRELIYTLPKTRAALRASDLMLRPVEQSFYDRERKWVDTLLELQAQGKAPEEWPRQPMHDLLADYEPIANAGHKTAQRFVNNLYPAYAQVERQGPGIANAWLVQKLGEFYADGADGIWNRIRMDLLTVLFRQYPTERWVLDAMRKLLPQTETLPFDNLERAMQPLLEKNTDPRVRAAALFSMAQALKARGDQRSYARAIELFTRVRDEYPDDVLRQPAEGGRAELEAVMPGHPAVPTKLKDAEGLPLDLADYKGRAVMLEFWSFESPPYTEAIPARAALHEKYQGRPFALIGINLDNRQSGPFHALAAKHGVRWRCASTYSTNSLLSQWAIRCRPSTILIDKDGIIRARDLPWAEMTALAEELVVDAEKSAPLGPAEPR
jgi:peroxiredoxin